MYIIYWIKAPFSGNSVLLMRHHATPVVTLSFNSTHVTYVTPHYYTVVIRYSTSVTYGLLSYASGYLVIYREYSGFERAFFYLALLPAFSMLPWGWQFNLKVSKAPCSSSRHSPGQTYIKKIYMWQVLFKV